MPAAAPLPESLADGPFSIAAARSAGVPASRLRRADLVRPWIGVRSTVAPHDLPSHAAAFAQRMRTGHVFAGVTAARLWGMPVASLWKPEEPLVVGVPAGTPRTRVTGVRTREFDPRRLGPTELDGLPILAPAATVMSLARDTEHRDLVALVDALVTPSRWYPDLRLPKRAYADIAALAAFARRCRGLHGAAAFSAAVDDARAGADSPQETRTRLVIVAAGLPEPVLQHPIRADGRRIAVVDLAYPHWRIAIEYEGEGHLKDPAQWAKDIRRYERLEALGWIVIRVTKSDLTGDAAALTQRVRAAVARRSTAD
ncbi:endonuclease domain-containing protein [Agrococcus beijingensis]|uniref:endonuclease domain-containing protein n=1 Tax=Agrococcus beijingensis TaxID=3068634 RepID=UPI0027422BB9|nr:hypothetical protein [Agrococcus sp. REN33]